MKIGSYTQYGAIALIFCLIASTAYFYKQLQAVKKNQTQTTVSTTYDTDGDLAPDNTQELVVEVGTADESVTEIAVVPRPIDEATKVKDPAFIEANSNTKIYARINGEKLIELPSTLTTETKIGDAKITFDEKRTTILDIRTPKEYAEFGVGKTFSRTGKSGYRFSYEVPIGGAGIKAEVSYDTDDSKIAAMAKFPLKK